MLLKNRFIWSDNGVLKDLSDNLNNSISGSQVIPFVAAQDYLYLGSEAPFNHRWFEVSAVNAALSLPSVALWNGKDWSSVAEVIDLTKNSAGTASLTKSGLIAWVPDNERNLWTREDTVINGQERVTGLGGIKIFNLYWARISFSADLTLTTALSYVGHKFANDEDLYSLWPEFETDEAKTRFKEGLTTYDQVHFEAAKQVIRDLKGDQVINSAGQILEWEVLRVPGIHKAAELIYTAYGSDWEKERVLARQRYQEAMKVELFDIDRDANASLSVAESQFRTGRLVR